MTHIGEFLKIKEEVMLEQRYRTISLKELYEKEFPENPWSVQHIVPLEGITIVSGSPSSFKTFLCFSMALAIARGGKFLDTFQTTQANVLIVDEENHLREVKRRMLMLGGSDNLPIEFLSQEGFLVRNKVAQKKVLQICQEKSIGVLFIDSLVRVNDVDENSAKDMSDFFRELKKFCVQKITVVLIHHEKKEGVVRGSAQNRLRGSGDILASIDSHICLCRDHADKNLIIIEPSKTRNGKDIEPINVRVLEEDGRMEFVYMGRQMPEITKSTRARNSIAELLKENPEGLLVGAIVEELLKTTPIGDKTIRNAIKSLIEGGYVRTQTGLKNEKICFLVSMPI